MEVRDVLLVLGPNFSVGRPGGAPLVRRTVPGPKAEAGKTPHEVWGSGLPSLWEGLESLFQ